MKVLKAPRKSMLFGQAGILRIDHSQTKGLKVTRELNSKDRTHFWNFPCITFECLCRGHLFCLNCLVSL